MFLLVDRESLPRARKRKDVGAYGGIKIVGNGSQNCYWMAIRVPFSHTETFPQGEKVPGSVVCLIHSSPQAVSHILRRASRTSNAICWEAWGTDMREGNS